MCACINWFTRVAWQLRSWKNTMKFWWLRKLTTIAVSWSGLHMFWGKRGWTRQMTGFPWCSWQWCLPRPTVAACVGKQLILVLELLSLDMLSGKGIAWHDSWGCWKELGGFCRLAKQMQHAFRSKPVVNTFQTAASQDRTAIPGDLLWRAHMRGSTCASGTEVTQAFISRVCMSNVLLFAHHVTSAETCAVSLSLPGSGWGWTIGFCVQKCMSLIRAYIYFENLHVLQQKCSKYKSHLPGEGP